MSPGWRCLALAALMPLTACKMPLATGAAADSAQPVGFDLRQVGKSDIDMLADRNIRANLNDLRRLMAKLYKRNPREWRKTGIAPAGRLTQLFGGRQTPRLPELNHQHGLAAMRMAFNPDYPGDRILALIYGLQTMLLAAYNNKTDFYLLDELDPQKLHDSARNVEIAAWKLATGRTPSGDLLILSNAIGPDVQNLSYERLLSKIIARQDLMSEVVADRTRRTVKSVIQNLASAIFLPIY